MYFQISMECQRGQRERDRKEKVLKVGREKRRRRTNEYYNNYFKTRNVNVSTLSLSHYYSNKQLCLSLSLKPFLSSLISVTYDEYDYGHSHRSGRLRYCVVSSLLSMASASSSSATSSKLCFNPDCKEFKSPRPKKGWRLRTGDLAELCDPCGFVIFTILLTSKLLSFFIFFIFYFK